MHIGRAFGLIFLAVIVNGSVDHAQRTNRYRNTHDERDRQTDRQTRLKDVRQLFKEFSQ